MKQSKTVLALIAIAAAAGCADEVSTGSAVATPSDSFALNSQPFSIAVGEEKYMCFTQTLADDLVVDRIDYGGVVGVHHLLLAQTLAPEQDGAFICNTLFKETWVPLFGAGTTADTLQLPADTTFSIPKGTQILLQLHLLNATGKPISNSVEIDLHKSAPTSTTAGIYGFGTTKIALPPMAKSNVTNDCQVSRDLQIFAALPHMHLLGTAIKFEAGPSADSMKTLFELDNWSFNNQALVPLNLTLHDGDMTRVTCTFDNTTSAMVNFGESTHDEMCFFPVFISQYNGLDGCVDTSGWSMGTGDVGGAGAGGAGGAGGAAGAGGSGDQSCSAPPNEKGIGQACTSKGGECKKGLSCSAALDGTDSGLCISIGCSANADCGSAATCCAPSEGGGAIKNCLPDACRPSDCTPVQ
jgi:hypothetical protein